MSIQLAHKAVLAFIRGSSPAAMEIDYMEYSTDSAAQSAWVTSGGSNATFVDESCTALGSWADGDTVTGVSTQVTFDGQETFKFHTGASTGSAAIRNQDFGSVDALGNRIVIEIKTYYDLLGTISNSDFMLVGINRSDMRFLVGFTSDGVHIRNAGWTEVGTNLVILDSWQTWLFDIDLSAGISNAVCDVYLGGILQASDVDCSDLAADAADGTVDIRLVGNNTANLISYVDYIRIGTEITLLASSESTIITQGSYALKLSATTDALNETVTKTLLPAGTRNTGNLFIDAQTTIEDENGTHTITANGNVAVSTAQSSGYNSSTSSIALDGTGDYLSVPDSADWDLCADTTDYTIDFWVKHSATGSWETYLSQGDDAGSNFWRIIKSTSDTLYFDLYVADSQDILLQSTCTLDTGWNHVALVKESTTYKFYLNGVNDGSVTDASTGSFAELLKIGVRRAGTDYLTGYLDNIRITKGTALWTSNFNLNDRTLHYETADTQILDLTGKNTIKFDARSTATGGNLEFSIHQAGDFASNATFVDEDCSALGSWIDGDNLTGVSSQATFDTQETFKFDSGGTAANVTYAYRHQDFGSLDAIGNRIVVTAKVYCDAIGTLANNDNFFIQVFRSDLKFNVVLASDGLYIHDGSAYQEIGTNLVVQDTWQTWVFDIDVSSGVASATCAVYLDGVLAVSNADCSYNTAATDGWIQLLQAGYTTTNRITYIDYLKIGSDFYRETHTINIASADTYQEEVIDISGVADADKDAIDQLQLKVVGRVDNSFVDEDCSALGSWVDSDSGTGSTTQVTFDTQETFRMTSGATASSANYAETSQDFGSLEGLGANLVVEIKVYCDAIGTRADVNIFNFQVQRSDWRLLIDLASDGLFVYDGSSFNEVGTNLVVQDTWQTWTFDIDLSAGVASATCDVYLGGVLQASDVDCSATGGYTDGLVQLDQAGTTTTNRITYVDYIKVGTSFADTFYIDNIRADESLPFMAATGGTITTDGDYKVHSFTSNGTFTVTNVGDIGTVEYLVVAGGGGGGGPTGYHYGGGGGAGGFLTASGFSVAAQAYEITVGAGGAVSTNGNDSVFSSITALGGGGGGESSGGEAGNGDNGANGGGGASNSSTGGTGSPGYNGGNGSVGAAQPGSGGGGGDSTVGGNGSAGVGGNGGAGTTSSITGSSVTYSGGGGGGTGIGGTGGAGGAGGGGDGGAQMVNGTAGTANTGGGGGGQGGSSGGATIGGVGGSGVVIIRYQFQ